MYYYDSNNKSPKRWATIASILYVLLLSMAFWLISFDFGSEELKVGDGIMIDFGTTEQGFGAQDMQATDVEAQPQTAATTPTQSVDEYVTTEQESEVEVKKNEPKPTPQLKNETETTKKPTLKPVEQVVEQPRKVNTKALFPGRTAGSKSTSEGTTSGVGNQGDPSGAANGSHDGTGVGLSGSNFNLSGRSLVGALPKPRYTANVTGKVVMNVTVDASGKVTGATFHPQGSTTNNTELVSAARVAALEARFSESESFVQGGTITYIFNMN